MTTRAVSPELRASARRIWLNIDSAIAQARRMAPLAHPDNLLDVAVDLLCQVLTGVIEKAAEVAREEERANCAEAAKQAVLEHVYDDDSHGTAESAEHVRLAVLASRCVPESIGAKNPAVDPVKQ